MSTPSAAPVIFDLDGTLVDSEPNYFEAGRQVLSEHGVLDFSWQRHAPLHRDRHEGHAGLPRHGGPALIGSREGRTSRKLTRQPAASHRRYTWAFSPAGLTSRSRSVTESFLPQEWQARSKSLVPYSMSKTLPR